MHVVNVIADIMKWQFHDATFAILKKRHELESILSKVWLVRLTSSCSTGQVIQTGVAPVTNDILLPGGWS